MQTIIMFRDGMPTLVPVTHEGDYLMKGYVRQVEASPIIELQPLDNIADSFTVSINDCSLKELVAGLNLTTAQAKAIIAGRPFSCIEDLIVKIDNVEWAALESKINFAEKK